MEDTLTLVFVCVVILIGFYLGQIWLSLIFAIILLALLFSSAKSGTAEPSAGGPAIRPIIVKRKYVGPESIYPPKMKINITKEEFGTGTPLQVSSQEEIGKSIGKVMGKLFKIFK
jgi:hypothetical protein